MYLSATRKVSVTTIRSYRDAFALRFLRDQKGIPVEKVSLDNLDAPTPVEWLDHLENARHCTPRSPQRAGPETSDDRGSRDWTKPLARQEQRSGDR